MATREQTEKLLEKFIKDKPLRAVAISGEWGSGKTYLVREYFKNAATEELLKASDLKFVYVSLFGLTSLEEARRRISTVVIGSSAAKLLGVTKWLAELAGTAMPIAGVPLNLATLGDTTASLIQEKVTHRLLICFDDLERAGTGISSQDILGLISELIEQRDCKCLLVFNKGKLVESHLATVAKQEEKIFDLYLEFAPTIADNLVHGLTIEKDRLLAQPAFTAFKNSNIRIMRRLGWVLQNLKTVASPDLDAHWGRVVQHASALAIVKYAHSDTVPDISVVLDDKSAFAMVFGSSGLNDKLPPDILATLKLLEFSLCTFDASIVQLLTTGSFDEAAFHDAVSVVAKEAKHNAEREELDALWSLLRNGFVERAETYVPKLQAYISRHHDAVKPVELIALSEQLLTIDQSGKTLALIEAMITPYLQPLPPEFREANLRRFAQIFATGIHQKIPFTPPEARPQLKDVFEAIAASPGSWDPSRYKDFEMFSDEEIRDFILAWRGDAATAQFSNLLDRVPGDMDAEAAKKIRERLHRIFDQIAQMDPVFRYQVENIYRRPR